jgi:hypothetical protein
MSFMPEPDPVDRDGTDLPPTVERTQKSTNALGISATAFANAMTKAFSQAVTGGKQFDEVLKSLALRLSSLTLAAAFKPTQGVRSRHMRVNY